MMFQPLDRLTRRFRTADSAKLFILRGREIMFALVDGDSGDQLRDGYETEVFDFIDSLPASSVFYDLGASIGHFALYAAASGIRTYAFEPDPANFGALNANVRANKFENLSILPIAISDQDNDAAVLRTSSAKKRIGDHHKVLDVADFSGPAEIAHRLDRAVRVTASSLDSAIGSLGLEFPSALKVDIDGSEMAFVRGAHGTLRDERLRSVLIELWKASALYEPVVSGLEEAGLHIISEHQIYSSIGIEEGLFNLRFDRTPTARSKS